MPERLDWWDRREDGGPRPPEDRKGVVGGEG